MKKWIVNLLKYSVFLGISVALFAYVYRDQNLEDTLNKLWHVDYRWVLMSIGVSLLSHISRAWRWVIALQPLGHKARLFPAFLAVMFGYAANLFVPRLGEVARCTLLKRTEGTPITRSFGAVVAERAVDLLLLLLFVMLGFLLEFDRIMAFLAAQLQDGQGLGLKLGLAALLLTAVMVVGWLLYRNRHRLDRLPLYDKIVSILGGIREGLFSIRRLTPSGKLAYLLHSVFIWLMYYLMAYLLVFSMTETEHLPAASGVVMLVMSAFAMVLPTPGGVGSYHYFVMLGLSFFYQIDETVGANFALLMHSSQFITVLVVGLLSFVVSLPFKPVQAET